MTQPYFIESKRMYSSLGHEAPYSFIKLHLELSEVMIPVMN